MTRFDLMIFLEKCRASMEEFRKEEEKEFPEHALMHLSTDEINRRFKARLDEIKKEHGFMPGEVYISSEPDGQITSVDMGATLLGLEVSFRVWSDVRQLSKRPKWVKDRWVAEFSFEREVAQEYNRCVRLFEDTYRQLKSTWKARDVDQRERERALRFIDEAIGQARGRLSAYRKTQASNAAKKHVRAELDNLNLLEARLKELDPRRRIRP